MKKKNLTIINLLAIKARNRIIVIVITARVIMGPTMITATTLIIVTATTPIVIAAMKEDMGTCTQQATVVAVTEEVEVTGEVDTEEEGTEKEEVKG